MKELTAKLFANLHVIIMLYSAYGLYVAYDEHSIAMAQLQDQKPALLSQIEDYQKKLEKIKEFTANIEATKEQVKQVFTNIEKVQKQLPSEINDIEILDFLTREGRGLNMPDFEPNPLQEQPLGFYVSKPYKITGRGTFLQMVIFLERLNSAERLYNVQSLKIFSDQSIQKSRFHVVNMEAMIDTFKYNSAHSESSGVDEIVNDKPAEAVAPRRRRTK
jgi:Tfp pilus assembly protein PilO